MTDRPLRIAVWHNLSSGGGKRALYYHVRGLVERGHHVEAWCPSSADQNYLPLSSLADEHVIPIDLSTPRPLRALTRAHLRTDIPRLMASVDRHCRVVADAIGDRFDVVLAGSCMILAVAPLARYVQPPSALYLGEPNRRLYEATLPLPWLGTSRTVRAATRKQARAELVSIAAYDRVLVNSRFTRENVLRSYGVDSYVCYLGVDGELFQPEMTAPRDYLVGVGAFIPEKNIELVLNALGQLDPPRPPLVWIGDHAISDAYVDELGALARRLDVSFTPRRSVTDDELVQLVRGARAMVYSPRLEPFGFAPLEANACGVPVIAGAEGGLRESVIDDVNGLLVEPHVDAFAAAIDRLWRHPVEAAELGAAGREHVVKNWSVNDAVERLERHLIEVSDGV